MRLLPAAAAVLGLLAQTPQKPPLIRSQITTVPVDVRVLDRDGRPITDLTAADFTVLENGVPQTIQHFSSQSYVAEAPAPAGAQPALLTAERSELQPTNRRIVLLILGRGRHQAVSRYIDDLIGFVSKDLLPQDQVAVMAWNRATDFTTDRAHILSVLRTYRERHNKVDLQLREWFSGLRAVYGSKEIPPHVQREIDTVFATAAGLRPRELTPSPVSEIAARLAKAREGAEAIYADELQKTFEDASFLEDMRASILASISGMSFEEYAPLAIEVSQELGNLYAAIDYLRYLEGEKHIIFLTERGVDLPMLEGNRGLASVAADARVAVNIIQTGGAMGAPPARYVLTPNGPVLAMAPTATSSMAFNQGFSVRDLRMIAETTGGQMAAYKRSSEAFRQLRESIGHQYVLAYSPVKPATDGAFRKIEVKVNRPGARVFYRHGYFATARVVPLNRRDFITFSRIRAAAALGREIDHIGVRVEEISPAASGHLDVKIRIAVDKLSFTGKKGLRHASLDVALYAGDRRGASVGEALSRVDLAFPESAYQEALQKGGAAVTVRMAVKGVPVQLKAVVYDYGADLLGTTVRRIQ